MGGTKSLFFHCFSNRFVFLAFFKKIKNRIANYHQNAPKINKKTDQKLESGYQKPQNDFLKPETGHRKPKSGHRKPKGCRKMVSGSQYPAVEGCPRSRASEASGGPWAQYIRSGPAGGGRGVLDGGSWSSEVTLL